MEFSIILKELQNFQESETVPEKSEKKIVDIKNEKKEDDDHYQANRFLKFLNWFLKDQSVPHSKHKMKSPNCKNLNYS